MKQYFCCIGLILTHLGAHNHLAPSHQQRREFDTAAITNYDNLDPILDVNPIRFKRNFCWKLEKRNTK